MAGGGLGKAREDFVGFLLELWVGGFGDRRVENFEERGEGGGRDVGGYGDDEVHECVGHRRHSVTGGGSFLLGGLGLFGELGKGGGQHGGYLGEGIHQFLLLSVSAHNPSGLQSLPQPE